MKKIVLLCSFGMSTSLMVTKMEEAAKEQGYDCEVSATSISDIDSVATTADILFLGPQVRFQKASIAAKATCPVEVIDSMAYGRMDGAAVIAKAREVLGD